MTFFRPETVENFVVASRNEFFKIGFMPYFLSSNSPLSNKRDRNYESALVVLNQHKEKCYSSIFSTFSRNNHVSLFFKE